MTEPLLVLVDKDDKEIGQMNKLEAHEKGLLHRAISVLIFNNKGEWLLQKRAASKYHSPSLWSNTSCSHPVPGEDAKAAAERRLWEEMGMKVDLKFAFNFIYRADFTNGLIEHELDHVFLGVSDDFPEINTEEADDFEYLELSLLLKRVEDDPAAYTEWFKILLPKVIEKL
jgi:isopentenyl-diphosphate delta-isomerase